MKKIILGLVIILICIVFVQLFVQLQPAKEAKAPIDCDARKKELFNDKINDIYRTAHLDTSGLSYDVYKKAMTGYFILKNESQVSKPIVTVVDFQKPSSQKRLWVIDVDGKQLLFNSLVAHGKNTGELNAESFSNVANSNMSSLGFYVTSDLYNGKHGLSMIVDGMENGFNDSARSRAIVMHGANYVSEDFVDRVGRLGRSQGCPAIPQELCDDIVCTICDKSVLFIYYPDEKYLAHSSYLKEELAYDAFALQTAFSCQKYKEMLEKQSAGLFNFRKGF